MPRGACPHCGWQDPPVRSSVLEAALNVVCGVLLLAILAPVLYLSEQWIEHQAQKAIQSILWREQIENW
jgi:hypothetical protein